MIGKPIQYAGPRVTVVAPTYHRHRRRVQSRFGHGSNGTQLCRHQLPTGAIVGVQEPYSGQSQLLVDGRAKLHAQFRHHG